jgi:hypothetical protein
MVPIVFILVEKDAVLTTLVIVEVLTGLINLASNGYDIPKDPGSIDASPNPQSPNSKSPK